MTSLTDMPAAKSKKKTVIKRYESSKRVYEPEIGLWHARHLYTGPFPPMA